MLAGRWTKLDEGSALECTKDGIPKGHQLPDSLRGQLARSFYRGDMTWYYVVGGVSLAGLATALTLLIRARRRRRPRTRAEKLAAARVAARSMRRSALRPNRDVFERGDGVPDRYTGAIAENAVYGDAAHFDSGSGSQF